jgi:hypothetical protein
VSQFFTNDFRAQGGAGTTDSDGNYVIPHIAPGTYVIHVKLPGYSMDFDLIRPAVRSHVSVDRKKELLAKLPQVILTAGASRLDTVIHRGGAIIGRVAYDSGGGLDRAWVQAWIVSSDLLGDAVDDQFYKLGASWVARGQTDDRGFYRIAGLPQGTYRIEVRVRETGLERGGGFLSVFAPEAITEPEAKLVTVADGDELSDVDITIPMRKFHSISGTVMQAGLPRSRASVTAQLQGQTWKRQMQSDTDGAFRFGMLPQGTYEIEAIFPPPDEERPDTPIKRRITVQISDGDITDANLELTGRLPTK